VAALVTLVEAVKRGLMSRSSALCEIRFYTK
jgi:hypothetical protein